MKLKTLIVQGIPEETKRCFKAACDRHGKSMKDTLITFMSTYSKKYEANKIQRAQRRHR